MIDRPNWWMEGALARDWERRLKPVPPRPVRKVRRWSAVARSVYTVAGVWIAGLIATLLAVQVVAMSYRVDAMQAHYNALVRQEQQLQQQAAELAAPTTMVQDANTYHVTLQMAPPAPVAVQSSVAGSGEPAFLAKVLQIVSGLRRALIGQ
jgi:anti-sigma factor RsiW